MSTCSRKINEIKERLNAVSGYNDLYIFMNLTKISIIIYEIEKYIEKCEEIERKEKNEKI